MARPKLVLVGVGQLCNKPGPDGPFEPIEPAHLAARALERAADDAGDRDLLGAADFLACTTPLAWHYDDFPARVASLLGIEPARRQQTPTGGESPVSLLNEAANRIQSGEVRVALLAGGEAVYARRRARQESVSLDHWTRAETRRDPFGGGPPLANPLEARHGLVVPVQLYPLFENALRAHAGRSVAEHQVYVSELMARFAAVAATNPYAWFPEARTAEEIRSVTDRNRWIYFPYTKYMTAIMEVDQGAACIALSEAEAERRGIPPERRVTLLGGARGLDAWSATERVDFVSSPGYRRAAARALELAQLDLERVDLFDLYSCFPSAIELALGALGLRTDDPRPLTVTGGLPYAGGPGNNYAMHALARMVEELRGRERGVGYVSGLGMTATKHSIALLSNDPARIRAAEGRAEEVALPEAECRGPELADAPDGAGAVETYTVAFDRANRPERCIVVVRLEDGRRTVAQSEPASGGLSRWIESEGVGTRGKVLGGAEGAPNRFVPEGGA
jgi:acetyl-CoA C-acetyltransferase